MTTHPVRIPEGTYRPLRVLSGLLGQTPGDLLETAFDEYVRNHKEEFTDAFDEAKRLIASRDSRGLVALTSRSRADRAARAAEIAADADSSVGVEA